MVGPGRSFALRHSVPTFGVETSLTRLRIFVGACQFAIKQVRSKSWVALLACPAVS